MSKSARESKQGCIISTYVDSFIKHGSNNIGKSIAFIMKDGTIIKARIRIAGKINDSELVYGLELDNDFQCTVGDDLKKEYHWNYKFLILVKQSIHFVEIDDKIGCVKSPLTNEAPGKFKNDELVLVKLNDSYKAAKIIKAGIIEGIFCYKIKLFQELCGERNLIVLESDVIKMLNEGLIFCQSYLELEEEDVFTLSIGGKFKNEDWEGILKWKGRVNGCPCVGIGNEEYESTDDFSKLAKKKDLYCVLIPLELKENIKEMSDDEYILTDNVFYSETISSNVKRKIAFKIKKDSILKGSILWEGIVNKGPKLYGIMTDYEVKDGTTGTYNGIKIFTCPKEKGILLRKSAPILDLNEDGTVKKNSSDIEEDEGEFSKDNYVMIKGGRIKGKIVRVGKINGIICYEVQTSFNKERNIPKSIIVIENDILKNKIKEPTESNIYTYFKKGAFVKLKDGKEGAVKEYILVKDQFHYLVKTETEVICAPIDTIISGVVSVQHNNAFKSADNLEEYGIITSMKKGSAVEIKEASNIFYGHISWMGFDRDNTFKFGITLERPSGEFDGKFYGQRLFTTERNCATLVVPSKVIPDTRFQKDQRRVEPKNKSNVVENYQPPRYTIDCANYKGIQGNQNSCYLDTSIFAIFTFNIFLESLILDDIKDSEDIKDLRNILRSHIIYPLRKDQYVSFDRVRTFREKLQKHTPNGNFLEKERDPEEFLEKLFHLLTPNLFLFKTKLIIDDTYEQKCFLTQLFYQCIPEKKKLSVLEMMALTFLESDMLISNPPKALILQLPRHGREMKKFETVNIPSKMDITPFVLVCDKVCKICDNIYQDIFICKECSLRHYKLIYYCEKHREECEHDTKSIQVTNNPYQGKVELELVAILCIEQTHYIAYCKTNESSEQWIYFNSMEDLKDGELIPHIRRTSLHEYFNCTETERKYLKSKDKSLKHDVERIEHYAFVCFYKNSPLEFYNTDFNSA